jgi:glycosyltransferase involved in cell wall biosynthesis
MRIGLVVTGGVDRSGRERVIPCLLWLIERLARLHDLHVFALHHEDDACSYPLLGATVHDLGTRRVAPGWRRLVQRRRLRTKLASLPRMDVLHAYWGIPAGWVTTSVARTIHVPVVVTADSGEFVADRKLAYGFQRRRLDRRLIAATMAAAARVTVNTGHMAGLAAGHDVTADVIPMGVPRSLFTHGASPAGPPWRLFQAAHLNRVKDQATLIRALAALRQTHPDSRLDVAGRDTLGGEIAQLARAAGVEAQVTFHGVLPHDAVQALMARAHVYVQSSRHEAAGVSVLEAAAAGLPTVGTNVGYVADWAPDAAIAVAPGDAAGLARGIAMLFDDPKALANLGARARARSAGVTADDTAAAFDALYRSMAARDGH